MPDSHSVFDQRQQGLIRALLYPILFQENPLEAVDRVLKTVVDRQALGATPAEYLEAVRNALASESLLGEILPQPHSEKTLREFLAKVANRLETNKSG
jgi:hypothetical protein